MWLFPRPDDAAFQLDLKPGEERIVGRDEECAVRLEGADVSRRHAQITRDGQRMLLTDLDSRNGTFVNGSPATSTPIRIGDVIRFGGCIGLITDRPGSPTELVPGLWAGPLLRAELAPLEKAARSDLPVILEGETGTGKEGSRAPSTAGAAAGAAGGRQLRGAARRAGRG